MTMEFATPATSPDLSANEVADLQRARAGDRPAFRRLVLVHQDRVYSLALRITGHHADAEELAQDAFLQLHGALAQVTSPDHLKHWLLRTVAHRAIDRLRQAARHGHVHAVSKSYRRNHLCCFRNRKNTRGIARHCIFSYRIPDLYPFGII
jgi:hypothetical protein